MARDRDERSVREMGITFLRQLKEAGEDEILLSPESAALVRSGDPVAASPRGAPVERSAEPATTPAKSAASVTGPAKPAAPATIPAKPAERASASPKAPQSVREKAAALPELDVIEVRLALGRGSDEQDMFVERTAVQRSEDLESVSKLAAVCEACELANTRTNVVFGEGSPTADLMFIGEAPGKNEDLEGVPFIGRAGELLNKILDAAEFERDDVYIANIIKCRPPNNRTPLTSEIEACVPFLARQIALISPRIICTLGLPATQTLLGIRGSMGSLRGKIYQHRDIKVIPTYHPAAALRDPKYKRPIWEDFLLIRKEYDRK